MSDDPLGPAFDLVPGVAALREDHGPIFAVVGVFDGLHLGHHYLLDQLRVHAERVGARPAVITFDSHPDEVLVGAAPPLLLDPADRLRLLRDQGVAVVVVQHFDAALRTTSYEAFVDAICRRVRLAGLLMTPEAAIGHERRGTPEALAALGLALQPPFEVVVVAAFTVDGRPVSSSEIRRRVLDGDLAGAAALLGRPYALAGAPSRSDAGDGSVDLRFPLPVAMPPRGEYRVTVVDADSPGPAAHTVATIRPETPLLTLAPAILPEAGRLRVVFD